MCHEENNWGWGEGGRGLTTCLQVDEGGPTKLRIHHQKMVSFCSLLVAKKTGLLLEEILSWFSLSLPILSVVVSVPVRKYGTR